MKMPHCVSWGWHQSLGSASPNSLTNGALPQAFNGPVRQTGHGRKETHSLRPHQEVQPGNLFLGDKHLLPGGYQASISHCLLLEWEES